ncbi:uncharacterized protein LOC122005220 isoform X1 [Zingiber officinale]|uniref:uncharacterized protein LOC122005220 isoform X1 n=1 Tax=Zingiber officinale TaxID=94328 RepID=UPI001C4BC7CE|nr:uncharacterized protein LOC122005220 isoform X1 [Zingiber officinale]XP_042416108.1 uncharacterized protein LOC122005220 isoform X1 [Zingiber officinale]
MVSREQKRAALHEKLQLLRSLTDSHALRKSSIILDASKYIQDLKQKVGRLKQEEAACEQSQVLQSSNSTLCSPQVIVETLEKGFLINVYSEKSCPGLLASVLDAFEELGLHVVEAKASCTDPFRLVAIGREAQGMEAQVVKEAVQRAVSCFFEEDSEEDMNH